MEATRDYTVHIDSKKRVTLRGAQYQYYNVKEYQNGCIILEPRELTVPEGISQETMRDMDRAIANFKKGRFPLLLISLISRKEYPNGICNTNGNSRNGRVMEFSTKAV